MTALEHTLSRRALRRARPGEHLCAIHRRPGGRASLTAAFVAAGIAAGDRVAYVGDRRHADAVEGALTGAGLEPGRASRRGQLVRLDVLRVHMPGGRFSADAGAAGFRAMADDARAAGFPALRVTSDADAVVAMGADPDELARWERMVDDLATEAGAVVMCQYDAAGMPPDVLRRVAGGHQALAVDDGRPPLALIETGDYPGALEVRGELDASNASALERALRARTRGRHGVEVDLGDVTFIDLTGLRAIASVAGELAPSRELRVRRAPPAMLRLLDLSGWAVDGLRVEA